MKIIDITRNAQEAPLYPGTPVPEIERISDVNKGDAYTVSRYVFTTHLGTHADAQSHFLPGSSVKNIEQMPLDRFYGPARVITVPQNALIAKKDLQGRIDGTERIVLHSGGKSYFSKEAADYLVAAGIKTIVTDAWSVAPHNNEKEIHHILLGAEIGIVENVILDGVEDGDYVLSAFPIKIKGADGAPVRAVLIK
ncbi:MAG: cyclase family protein [Spirochaetaceae bacterium]|jgi:arylformamidase|nr:cyclase family protein [Spirochaetaceae bacterium]